MQITVDLPLILACSGALSFVLGATWYAARKVREIESATKSAAEIGEMKTLMAHLVRQVATMWSVLGMSEPRFQAIRSAMGAPSPAPAPTTQERASTDPGIGPSPPQSPQSLPQSPPAPTPGQMVVSDSRSLRWTPEPAASYPLPAPLPAPRASTHIRTPLARPIPRVDPEDEGKGDA